MSVHICASCDEMDWDDDMWMCEGCGLWFHDRCEDPVQDNFGATYCEDCAEEELL